MAGIAARLTAITDAHGPDAVATYTGNPLAFNALGQAAAGALATGLGLHRTFSSGTQDCANKFVASQAVFGTPTVRPSIVAAGVVAGAQHDRGCIAMPAAPTVAGDRERFG